MLYSIVYVSLFGHIIPFAKLTSIFLLSLPLSILIVFLLDGDLDTILNYDKLHIITQGGAHA